MRDSVTACLVSWKRPQNISTVVRCLRDLKFVDEILIWNNNPQVHLQVDGPKVRVIESPENVACYGRFLCATQARNPVIYVQDDDAINDDLPDLYRRFIANPTSITHALSPWHYERRHRYTYGDCHLALLGWGAFFMKDWVGVLEEIPPGLRREPLFRREADKFFSILLERRHNTFLGSLRHLDGHSTQGVALWLEPDHHRMSALAVREALRLVRLRKKNVLPVPWNVVVVCYNYGRFLAEAVRSVAENDADYHLTIVDDASTDETPEVARELVRNQPHVTYVRNTARSGTGFSRNRGIAAVDSTFVVLLDADDRLGPNYLAAAGQVLTAGADVANPDAILFGLRHGRWPVPEETTLAMLLRRNPVHYCAAFRRGYWAQIGGFDEHIPNWEDYEFWIRMAAAGARIRAVEGDHFFYRQHAASRTSEANAIKDALWEYIRTKHAPLFERYRNSPEA